VKRLLVTGSRTWTDEYLMGCVLRSAWVHLKGHKEGITLVHGGADGADTMAEEFWRQSKPEQPVEVDRPNYERDGKGAPFARNNRMAQSGIDLAVAFAMPCNIRGCPQSGMFHFTHGTAHCFSACRTEQVPVWLIGQWS
jgi:hypothetical protein